MTSPDPSTSDSDTLIAEGAIIKKVPRWRAKELIKSGLARLAVVRIKYPQTWPILAQQDYPEGQVVVVERPAGPMDKPPVNPYLPEYLSTEARELQAAEESRKLKRPSSQRR
ncbi:hypothetical protein ACQI4L_26240 [Mycolicibacterium litorale]|uniref:hypothetical protein n=1 Tax=Mycolicibacterium litorale TaxID=758802 RepID=UPI003CFA70FE